MARKKTKKILSQTNPPKEDEEQEALVRYLEKYDLPFKFDYLSGARLPMGIAMKAKRFGNTKSWPDCQIAVSQHGYHSFFLELKRTFQSSGSPNKIYKRDGTPRDEHYEEQLTYLKKMARYGNYACMVIGYERAVEIIDAYLFGFQPLTQEDFDPCFATIF